MLWSSSLIKVQNVQLCWNKLDLKTHVRNNRLEIKCWIDVERASFYLSSYKIIFTKNTRAWILRGYELTWNSLPSDHSIEEKSHFPRPRDIPQEPTRSTRPCYATGANICLRKFRKVYARGGGRPTSSAFLQSIFFSRPSLPCFFFLEYHSEGSRQRSYEKIIIQSTRR